MRNTLSRNHKTLTKSELLRVVNAASRERFGVSATKLTRKERSGSTPKSAEARRLDWKRQLKEAKMK